MARLRLPGLAVTVIDHDRVIWAKGYGFADVERRLPVTPDTPFNIASLTKPMTAVLIMQMVERGELSLDDPISAYAPGVARPEATIRHVLTMTAESDPPGSAYSYNGDVFATLGRVLEARTGWSFRHLLKTRLLDPVRMKRTVPGLDVLDSGSQAERFVAVSDRIRYAALADQLARPYRVFGGTEIVPALPPPPELDAAANVISTVLDYARFVNASTGRRLLGDATRAVMWAPNVRSDGSRLPYALGWFVEDYEGERLIWHHGYWPDSYSSLVLVAPGSRIALVAMANADGLSAPFYRTEGVEGNVLACAFLRAFVREALSCPAVSEAAVGRWEANVKPTPLLAVQVDGSVLDRYEGAYRTPGGRRVRIAIQDGRLWWQPSRGGLFELFPLSQDRFFLKAADYLLTFVVTPGDAVSRIDLRVGDQTVPLVRDNEER